jgi:hypothetical protein
MVPRVYFIGREQTRVCCSVRMNGLGTIDTTIYNDQLANSTSEKFKIEKIKVVKRPTYIHTLISCIQLLAYRRGA